MKTALLISTYNWPEALNLVLKSVTQQSTLPDEIIIADDGSQDETKSLVKHWKSIVKTPVKYIWHEDLGFRKTIIMNKAFAASESDYIVQIDGDVVLHPKFIEDHKKLAKHGNFISGSRVLLNQEATKNIIESGNIAINAFSDGIKNRFNTLHFPLVNEFIPAKKEPIEKLIYKIRGCNMSFWRDDVLAINGYDEDFLGWGREDSEFALRLLKKGLALKKIKTAAVQYHLHHRENDRGNFEKNHALMMAKLEEKKFRCENGILKN